jgi:hypothetical protein
MVSTKWRGSGCLFLVAPAKEAVRKSTIAGINIVRPSRRPRGLLRMRNFINAIKGLPHAEERQKGASRSTHYLASTLLLLCKSIFVTPSKRGPGLPVLCPPPWMPAFAGMTVRRLNGNDRSLRLEP